MSKSKRVTTLIAPIIDSRVNYKLLLFFCRFEVLRLEHGHDVGPDRVSCQADKVCEAANLRGLVHSPVSDFRNSEDDPSRTPTTRTKIECQQSVRGIRSGESNSHEQWVL
jgi:hypothetical protein